MRPVVSVVMPVFNGERWIASSLGSALSQSFAGLEAVVVNDGSTDRSAEAVRPFLKDPRVRYIERAHSGIPATRNAALAAAKGRYVGFLDQDDLWLPTKLERQVEFLESRSGFGAVHADVERIDADGRFLSVRPAPRPAEGRLFEAFLKRGWAVPLLGVLARREALDRVGGFDEDLFGHDDFDLLLRLADQVEFGYLPDVLARQRWRPGTAGQGEEMYRDRLTLARKLAARWPERRRELSGFESEAHYAFGCFLSDAGRWREAESEFAAAALARPWAARARIKRIGASIRAALMKGH